MRNLFASLCLVLLGLTAGCVRASFSPVEGPDASRSDTASGGGDEPATLCSLTPFGSCSPQFASGATCDPVCQEGTCPCGLKCTVSGVGNVTTTTCASVGTIAPREPCTIYNAGQPSQYDECTPGHICISPDTGSGFAFCLPICRSILDCPGGFACGERPIPNFAMPTPPLVKVCDPEYLSCNPASPCCNPVTLSGCRSGEHCYLVSPDQGTLDSRTVCDYTVGRGRRDYTCTFSRECDQGWACDGGKCRQVCDPRVPSTCPAGGACSNTGSSGNQFGYCPP